MTATVDYLVDQGLLSARRGRWELEEPLDGVVPEGLRQLALRQVDRLDLADRRVLDAACVAGGEFTVASVAAGIGAEVSEVEDRCARLISPTAEVKAAFDRARALAHEQASRRFESRAAMAMVVGESR